MISDKRRIEDLPGLDRNLSDPLAGGRYNRMGKGDDVVLHGDAREADDDRVVPQRFLHNCKHQSSRTLFRSKGIGSTCLDGVDRQGQRIQVFRLEIATSASNDPCTGVPDFLAHAFLVLGVPGKLVQQEREGGRRRLVSRKGERVHLGDELFVV